VHDLVGNEVVVESEVTIKAASTILVSAATTTTTIITDDDITLAKALAELKTAKLPTTTPTSTIPVPKPPQDKGKWIMVEEPVVEQVKPIKRLEQMRLDEELAFKLQAKEEEEEERISIEKAQQVEEANIA
ncbi:hypothetical protein Tco_0063163, partial [Tanacetum coccineum]